MRKALVTALDGLRRAQKLWLKIRGLTPEGIAEQRIVSGEAWDEFCDTLKAAGATLKFPGTPQDPFTQAEGYRYLSRLARAGLEGFLEDGDPEAPVLKRVVHETVKMGADNPDNHYQNAVISGAFAYRIRGNRGTVHALAFGTQAGHYGQGGGMPPTGALHSTELALDENGDFTIAVSSEPRPGNWLPMKPETGLLIVRQTFLDRKTERLADVRIERVDGPNAAAPAHARAGRPGPARREHPRRRRLAPLREVGARFSKAHQRAAALRPRGLHPRGRRAEHRLLPQPLAPRARRGARDRGDAARAATTGTSSSDDYWMESLDYRFFTISLNKHSARAAADGSVRIVVAHADPGTPNWITTAGHAEGTMCFRWVRADAHPVPRTRVVKLAEIAAR